MTCYRFGEYELNLARRELSCAGESLSLQPKVFAVLALLVQNPGQALGKDDFLEQVWSGRFVTENVLTRCIRELRKLLQDDAQDPAFIRTVRGHGYAFVAPVDQVTRGDAGQQLRVAVLPFQPLVSGDAHTALERGLSHTLINDLSRIEHLVVRPLDAVLHARNLDPEGELLSLARRLDVDILIEGQLQVAGNRVRISVRALQLPRGNALLSERFEAPLTDLFLVQDTLSSKVAQALSPRLTTAQASGAMQRGTRSVEAYQAYVDGRLKLAEHSVSAMKAALAHFERALYLDPDYLEPLIGVAEANEVLATLGTDPTRYYENSRQAAEAVIAADPERARAYACLGKVAWQHDWDWPQAEIWLRHATELDPGDAETLIALSDFLCYQARFGEALEVAERAGEINPFSPWIQALIAQALYMGGRFDEAVQQAQRALVLAPDFGFSHFFLGLAQLETGQGRAAVDSISKATELTGRQDFAAVLGNALARTGREAQAREMLAALRTSSETGEAVPPIAFALIHTGLDEADCAIEYFSQVKEQRSWHLLLLHADPTCRKIRARPEGLALLREAGLPA